MQTQVIGEVRAWHIVERKINGKGARREQKKHKSTLKREIDWFYGQCPFVLNLCIMPVLLS